MKKSRYSQHSYLEDGAEQINQLISQFILESINQFNQLIQSINSINQINQSIN